MVYRLLTSRILYQTSKYAPVAVVCLEFDIPGGSTPGVSLSLLNATLGEVSQHGSGGAICLSGTESPLEAYCELVIKLQRYAGHEVAYSRINAQDVSRECRVFIEYEDPASALYAADVALDLLNANLENPEGVEADTTSVLQQQLHEYVTFALARRLDPNTRLLKHMARQRGIPAMSLDPFYGAPTWPGAVENSGVIQYGWGINQRQCRGALPLGTISSRQFRECLDRASVLPRLKDANLPIADQDMEFTNRNQTRRAQRSARRIGYPVTIRPKVAALPQYGYLDNGAFGPLENDEQVAVVASYLREKAKADIWVESFVSDAHYRFLILDDEVVSVLRFAPPTVVGDGVRSIAALAEAKAEATKGAENHRIWHLLAKGDDALSCRLTSAGMGLSSIPAAGDVINLRGEGNYYNGGTCVEVSDRVPASFNAVALQAAEVCGLKQMAGVDLVIKELQGSTGMPNCAITGVDPVPDLVSHSKSPGSNYRRISEKFFSQLFSSDKPPRIPTVSVTGTNGKTTTSRMVAGILKESGLKVGLSCSDGVYLDDDVLLQGDEAGVLGAIEVLSSPEIEAAVLETARGNLANAGVAFDQVDVGACLNIADDHLGLEGIETLDQMAVHKRQVIERSVRAIVLNAEDPLCVAMREHTTAREVILFACNPDHPEVTAHVRDGGCAVVVDEFNNRPSIILKHAQGVAVPVMAVADIPATKDGAVLHNVYNALAAVGIARGLGISVEHIVSGLAKFVLGVSTTPGRLNEIPGFPFDVLVDAAHNPHGIRHLVQYVNQRVVDGKRIIVFGARAALPEQTIQNCAALIAGNFDLYILRNYRPGDSPGPLEAGVIEIIRSELIRNGVSASNVVVVPGVLDAIDSGIGCSEKGDLLVVQVPAGGNDKFDMINRIKDSECRADEDLVKTRASDLAQSEPDDSDMKLLLCGDVMLGRGIDQVLPNPGNPRLHENWRNIYDAREFVRLAQQKHGEIDDERDMAYVWGNVLPEIEEFAPELRLINLETAVTTHNRAWPEKLVHFRMNPQNVEVLKHAEIDFCALANNHVMDWGREGLEETIHALDRAGIRYAGAGPCKHDAEEPTIMDVPGKGRVIVVSMGTVSSGIPGDWIARDDIAGVNLVELKEPWVEDIHSRLADIKQPGDVLVVSIHWGGNYEAVIPQNQREFAWRLIDKANVDIVHGHSSHHVRGIELHHGKLILYGCGDLVNDYEGVEKSPERRALAPDLGLMYFVRVSPENGAVTNLQMVPTKMQKLRVVRGDRDDAERLLHVLNRECIGLGTVVVNENGILHLKAMSS